MVRLRGRAGFILREGSFVTAENTTSGDVFVHPHGLCESDSVGAGTRIWAFAHVLPGAVVGRDCNICDGAYVEWGAVVGNRVTIKNQVLIFEGVTVEDDVFLGPGVIFTNDMRPRAAIKRSGDALLPTLVRQGATLGAGVVVVCGHTIGRNAFVGAGAVVATDVPDHAFMVGNPARQRGWACACGDRLADDLSCGCGRAYQTTETGLVELIATESTRS
jgi:acetyltransferase-like isoleucine patch superfamily enzyme